MLPPRNRQCQRGPLEVSGIVVIQRAVVGADVEESNQHVLTHDVASFQPTLEDGQSAIPVDIKFFELFPLCLNSLFQFIGARRDRACPGSAIHFRG